MTPATGSTQIQDQSRAYDAPGEPIRPFPTLLRRPVLLRRLAFASIVGNITIVVTGAAVRLTASGLGCPTWPRCTDASYTTTAEIGLHGAIEFGNRLLVFVLGRSSSPGSSSPSCNGRSAGPSCCCPARSCWASPARAWSAGSPC